MSRVYRYFHRGTGTLIQTGYPADLANKDTLEKLNRACGVEGRAPGIIAVPEPEPEPSLEAPRLRRTLSINPGASASLLERLSLITGRNVDASGYDLESRSNEDLVEVQQHVTLTR